MRADRPEGNDRPNMKRRTLFRGVSGGVGVLMAVQAKTALGSVLCQSPSAMFSGNTSHQPGTGTTCSGGVSPGFWKQPQKFSYWTGATPPTFNVPVSECLSGMQNLTTANETNHGTLLSTLFTGAPSGVGMWDVLAFPTDYANGQLLRTLTAAWLNAKYAWPGGTYPLTPSEVQSMWAQIRASGYYCPTSMTCAANTGWTSSQVISYIQGMYDLNAATVEGPNLCKKN